MKIFISYLKDFIKEHFQWAQYILFFLLCAIILYWNFAQDLENISRRFLIREYGKPGATLYYFLLQGLSFYIMLLLSSVARKDWSWWKKPGFYFWSILGFLILAVDRSYNNYSWLTEGKSMSERHYLLYVLTELKSWVLIFIPLLIIYFIAYRKEDFGFFGVRLKGVKFKPYWYMLGIMFPLVLAASFHSSFLNAYPRFPVGVVNSIVSAKLYTEFQAIIIYEISYLLDFFTVELFFRGFLILGLLKYLGKEAIIPMAVSYCALHFGKPFGEALSSIFGGYILGVFAYYSKNIWGGIFIHMGIAGLMELMAFLQKSW